MTDSEPFDIGLSGPIGEWLLALPEYQRGGISEMLKTHDPIEVATLWLESSGPSDTAPFGGVRNAANNFYNNILRELQKAVCTAAPEYEANRTALREATQGGGKLLLVGALATAIAPHVGAAAAVIGPAVALTMAVIGNAGKQTACDALDALIVRRTASA